MQTLMLCLGSLWYKSLLKKIDNWYDFWLRMELVMAVKISIVLENICQVIYHSETWWQNLNNAHQFFHSFP